MKTREEEAKDSLIKVLKEENERYKKLHDTGLLGATLRAEMQFKIKTLEQENERLTKQNDVAENQIQKLDLELQQAYTELKELREGIVKALNEKLDGYDKATDRYVERCTVFDCIKIVETLLTKTNQDE